MSESQGCPKISIVTPSYNQGRYIEETILSIINQNYPNLEYIIVDGGSTDETVEVIRKYEKHITWWVSEKDAGQSDAINKGLKKVTGEIFNWLNSDDYLAEGALMKVAAAFNGQAVDVVCGSALNFTEHNSRITPPSTFFDKAKGISAKPNINQPSTFWRTEVVRKLGELKRDLHYCMDLEWWLKYILTEGTDRIVTIDAVLSHFREHDQSKSLSQKRKFATDKLNLYSALLHQCEPRFKPLGNYRFSSAPASCDIAFLQRIFNDDFYLEALLNYGEGNFSKARELMNYIDPEFLLPQHRRQFGKMKFRSTFIPAALLRMLRSTPRT